MSVSGYDPDTLSPEAFGYLRLLHKRTRDRIRDICIYNSHTVFAISHRQRTQPGFDPVFRSLVHAFYHGQVRRKGHSFTLQGDSPKHHRHYLKGFGTIQRQERNTQEVFKVTLINNERNHNLVESFRFEPASESLRCPQVSKSERELLRTAMRDKRQEVRDKLFRIWADTPEMPVVENTYAVDNLREPFELRTHQPYIQPQVSDLVVLKTGVAAFLSLDQIGVEDKMPIMRHQAWLLTSNHFRLGSEPVRYKTVARAGYNYIRLVTANPHRAILMTATGKGRLPL